MRESTQREIEKEREREHAMEKEREAGVRCKDNV
jgi:hypothetical protein